MFKNLIKKYRIIEMGSNGDEFRIEHRRGFFSEWRHVRYFETLEEAKLSIVSLKIKDVESTNRAKRNIVHKE